MDIARHSNPIIKHYYEKLIARGKPGKVAVIACERKLLHMAWACVVKERMFETNMQVLENIRS